MLDLYARNWYKKVSQTIYTQRKTELPSNEMIGNYHLFVDFVLGKRMYILSETCFRFLYISKNFLKIYFNFIVNKYLLVANTKTGYHKFCSFVILKRFQGKSKLDKKAYIRVDRLTYLYILFKWYKNL